MKQSKPEIQFLDLKCMNLAYEAKFNQKFKEILSSGCYVLGDEVQCFEKEFASYCNTKHCIGVANGLEALYISLKTIGVGKGDEVIVPANTFIATWLAVNMTGATPVPVEPRIETYNINPDLIAEKITRCTKAIIPVHLYGQPCEMAAILEIADVHHLNVVEDNAQAQGAKFNGVVTGSFGHINSTSFYPSKNLGALGDGGAITTNNAELALQTSTYRNYGSQQKYYNQMQGINSRLDELQAAFLRIKLEQLDEDNAKRRNKAMLYYQQIQDIGDIQLPQVDKNVEPVYHLYVIRTDKRDALAEHLKRKGIATMVHYPIPPHLQQAYKEMNFKKGDFPITEKIADTCLSLPFWPQISENEISKVASAVKEFYGN